MTWMKIKIVLSIVSTLYASCEIRFVWQDNDIKISFLSLKLYLFVCNAVWNCQIHYHLIHFSLLLSAIISVVLLSSDVCVCVCLGETEEGNRMNGFTWITKNDAINYLAFSRQRKAHILNDSAIFVSADLIENIFFVLLFSCAIVYVFYIVIRYVAIVIGGIKMTMCFFFAAFTEHS